MSKLTAIIADDESFARDYLLRLLKAHENIEVLAVCNDGQSAALAIREHRPDVVFLDIQMPGISGLDVLHGLPEHLQPSIIFCTAYDQYALRAFDLAAADYLLKPFDAERLNRAIARVNSKLKNELGTEAPREIASSPQKPMDYLQRIIVKHQDRLLIVATSDLIWAEADDKQLRLHTNSGVYLLRQPIKELESSLDPGNFMRVHRSSIVAINQVREAHALPDGDYALILHNGSTLTLSRTYRDAFFNRLKF
jgi:two-component system, LytTR family, response regulator